MTFGETTLWSWRQLTGLVASEGGGGTAILAIKDSMSCDERRWRMAARPAAPSASISSGMVRLVRDVSSSAASWPRDSLRLPDALSMVRPPKKNYWLPNYSTTNYWSTAGLVGKRLVLHSINKVKCQHSKLCTVRVIGLEIGPLSSQFKCRGVKVCGLIV